MKYKVILDYAHYDWTCKLCGYVMSGYDDKCNNPDCISNK